MFFKYFQISSSMKNTMNYMVIIQVPTILHLLVNPLIISVYTDGVANREIIYCMDSYERSAEPGQDTFYLLLWVLHQICFWLYLCLSIFLNCFLWKTLAIWHTIHIIENMFSSNFWFSAHAQAKYSIFYSVYVCKYVNVILWLFAPGINLDSNRNPPNSDIGKCLRWRTRVNFIIDNSPKIAKMCAKDVVNFNGLIIVEVDATW